MAWTMIGIGLGLLTLKCWAKALNDVVNDIITRVKLDHAAKQARH
ncbi:MAG TPA: hypothetical protein VGJ20_11175 [Xanthobacteraceae bacterium]|jgi:hypothetical protein